jgi:hypothetical protein
MSETATTSHSVLSGGSDGTVQPALRYGAETTRANIALLESGGVSFRRCARHGAP